MSDAPPDLLFLARLTAEASPETLLEEASLTLMREASETLEDIGRVDDALYFRLHPLAPALRLSVDEGVVRLEGATLDLGPGYAAYARDLGRQLFAALGAPPPPDDVADAFTHLGAAARAIGARRPAQLADFGVHRYPEVAIATALGPRSESWLAKVASSPQEGLDAFPWALDGLGPAHRLGRALGLLWHEARFRAPLTEAEDELMESILDDLTSAYAEAPELEYPVEAWAELSRLSGGPLPPPSALLEMPLDRALPGRRGPIGYRRGLVERDVGAGFSLRFDGALAEEDREDGIFIHDLRRSVHVAGIEADPDASAEELFAEAPPPEGEALSLRPRTPQLALRAAVRREGDDEVLTAVAAARGRLCLLTVVAQDDPDFIRRVAQSLALA